MLQQKKRNLFPVISAASLAVLSMGLSARAANLLVNPGFENPTDLSGSESTTVTGWTLYSTAMRAAFQNHTAGGRWSLWHRAFEPSGGAFQTISGISGGTSYSFSAFYYFEASYASSGATSDIRLSWSTGDVSELDILPSTIGGGIGQTPTNTWTQFTLSAMAPAGATSVIASLDWFNGSNVGGAQSAFADDGDFEGIGAPPTTPIWNGGSGNWNLSSNWSTNTIPNGIGQEADLFTLSGGGHTVYSDTAITVGTLNFSSANPNTYVLAGAGSLTMQASSGSAVIKVQTGNQKINLPLFINSNTTLSIATGTGLKISDPMTVNPGFVVSQSGGGTVTYESTVTVLGGAGLMMTNSTHMAGLSLINGSTTLTAGAGALLRTDSLSVDATSKLDLNDNDMIVGNGSYATVASKINSARSGGTWSGNGITSTSAKNNVKHNTTLGTVTGAQYHAANGASASFDGQGVSDTDLLVKYTYYGDANFNGIVDGGDYSRIDTTFNQEHTAGSIGGWFNGDFNYDSTVDGADYALIDGAFNSQSGTLRQALAIVNGQDPGMVIQPGSPLFLVQEHFDEFGGAYAQAFINAVPEPATIGLIALPLMMGARRRRTNVG